jgi:hypothetical protein
VGDEESPPEFHSKAKTLHHGFQHQQGMKKFYHPLLITSGVYYMDESKLHQGCINSDDTGLLLFSCFFLFFVVR